MNVALDALRRKAESAATALTSRSTIMHRRYSGVPRDYAEHEGMRRSY
jgi:hypothetical protein